MSPLSDDSNDRPGEHRQGEHGDASETWASNVPQAAARLFLKLPERFGLDDVVRIGDELGQPYAESVGYVRLFRAEEMVAMRGADDPAHERYAKTGRVT